MAITKEKLAFGWRSQARGGVQVVDALCVAQGRTMPFFVKEVDTELEIS